ncbi:hypothetical protein ACFO4N_15635 [Camelliibacillus cellulosilyticus]|uniref:Uncharacterized protein n=1 Tax=Camelliibacillus cellulosilyticus TaxID=2174486 RepID=A0ABV9GSA4_9BACL
MNKRDVQALYNEVIRRKYANLKKRNDLFEPRRPKGGCSTCGKVTWKPY